MAPDGEALASITIDSSSIVLERGTRTTLTATVRNRLGAKVDVPVVWRISNQQVASLEFGGVIFARDTGTATLTAASASIVSPPVPIRVVWVGPARIAAGTWSRPSALSPGARLHDSIRVVVTNIAGAPVGGARVTFSVTAGGGMVSPAIAATSSSGSAATQWTLGPAIGRNVVRATVVLSDGSPDTLVAGNAVDFTITSYRALLIQTGDAQTQQILSTLPVNPSVRLVDSLGAPRRGIPVTFTASGGGSVAAPFVSTGDDGIASPGAWLLGDANGDQMLTATVEDATVALHATATGTPIHYRPAAVIAGAYSTCALELGVDVRCWGQAPQNGSGTMEPISAPTPVVPRLSAVSLASGASHFCALGSANDAWCWGANALLDTTGNLVSPAVPTRIPGTSPWLQITTGNAHSCAIAADHSAACWGMNSAGQLGVRDTVRRSAPISVAGSFTFSQITAGAQHTCALAPDGAAFCWGLNQAGQLGDGTAQSRTTPTAVAGSLAFRTLAAGDAFTCGLTTAGRLYCWGAIGGAGQLAPVAYDGTAAYAALTAGGEHACVLDANGNARCWGSNTAGQLGDSTFTSRAAPVDVSGGFRFAQISAGHVHTCARTIDGDVVCWGYNGNGELGDRAVSARPTPRYLVLGVHP